MKFLWTLIFLVVFCWPVSATTIPPFSARVQVFVSADENIQGQIESYLSRELRSLGDVVVTDARPEWILNVGCSELCLQNGYKSGLSLSVVILRPFYNDDIMSLVSNKSKRVISTFISDLYSFDGHWFFVCNQNNLKSTCSEIIAKFDSSIISQHRVCRQNIIDNQKFIDSQSSQKGNPSRN